MLRRAEHNKNEHMRDGIIPPVDVLRAALRYEPETGRLYRRDTGSAACATRNSEGYLKGSLNNSRCFAHRVIWKLVYGEEPKFIDHVNGDKTDNRIANLRSVRFVDNLRNRQRPITNTSGVIGVNWNKAANLWTASIPAQGKRRVSYFKDKQEAVECRRAWERELGFHPNHGR